MRTARDKAVLRRTAQPTKRCCVEYFFIFTAVVGFFFFLWVAMLCLGQVSFSYKPYYALLFPSGRLEKLQMFGCFSNVNACRCLLPKKKKKEKKVYATAACTSYDPHFDPIQNCFAYVTWNYSK